MFNLMNDRDYELITAYIDGALTEAERQIFEARLSSEPDLRQELNSLRQTVILLRQMPELKAPRDFTLTAAQVEARPAVRTTLPFPLTATFSALSAAAAVLLFVFGGYFLLQNTALPANSLTSSAQQEVQQAAPTGVALAFTATAPASPSPMATLPPPTVSPQPAQAEGEIAPFAAVAPEEQESATTMMFEADDADLTAETDAETAMFRLAATEMPGAGLMQDSVPADTNTGAAIQPTQRIMAPNPLMTDAALFATLGANFQQYGETPLPQATAAAIQNGADEAQSEMIVASATAEPTATTAVSLEATRVDGFAEPTVERQDGAQIPTDITGPLLLGVGGLLLVIAIITTILRRWRSQ